APEQFALPALAGDGGLRLEQRLARVEGDAALVLAGGVALGAAGLQQRDDLVREVDRGGGGEAGSKEDGEESEEASHSHSSPLRHRARKKKSRTITAT